MQLGHVQSRQPHDAGYLVTVLPGEDAHTHHVPALQAGDRHGIHTTGAARMEHEAAMRGPQPSCQRHIFLPPQTTEFKQHDARPPGRGAAAAARHRAALPA